MVKKILTAKQLEILQILWENDHPLLISEISEKSKLNVNTVQYSIKALTKTGYVEVADIVHSGNVLARTFRAVITQEQYMKTISDKIGVKDQKSKSLINLIEMEDDWNVLNEIERIIKSKRGR